MHAYTEYDDDLVAWALANADMLRKGQLSQIDADHLAEDPPSCRPPKWRNLLLSSALRGLAIRLVGAFAQPIQERQIIVVIEETRLAVVAPQHDVGWHARYVEAWLSRQGIAP